MIFEHYNKIFNGVNYLFAPFELSIEYGLRTIVYNLLREVIILELRHI